MKFLSVVFFALCATAFASQLTEEVDSFESAPAFPSVDVSDVSLDEAPEFLEDDVDDELEEGVQLGSGSCSSIYAAAADAKKAAASAKSALANAKKQVSSCPRAGVLTSKISGLRSNVAGLQADLKTLREVHSFVNSKATLGDEDMSAVEDIASRYAFVDVEDGKLRKSHHSALDKLIKSLIAELEAKLKAGTASLSASVKQRDHCTKWRSALSKAQGAYSSAAKEASRTKSVADKVRGSGLCSGSSSSRSSSGSGSSKASLKSLCSKAKSTLQKESSDIASLSKTVSNAKKHVKSCPRPGVLTARINGLRNELEKNTADLKTLNQIKSFVKSKATLADEDLSVVDSLAEEHQVFVAAEEEDEFVQTEDGKLRKKSHDSLVSLIDKLIAELQSKVKSGTSSLSSATSQRGKCVSYRATIEKDGGKLSQLQKSHAENKKSFKGLLSIC